MVVVASGRLTRSTECISLYIGSFSEIRILSTAIVKGSGEAIFGLLVGFFGRALAAARTRL